MSETNTGLIAFNQLPEIAAGAGEILSANKNLHDKAKTRAQELLDTIEGEGMSDELDSACNQFLATCSTAKEKMNARRAPVTKLFSAIASEFTTLENPFDKAKPGTFAYQIQETRNNYARQKEIEARKREDELRKQRLIEEEKINIKARVESAVREKYGTIIFNFKKKYNDLFNTIDLTNIEKISQEIMTIKVLYPRDKFLEIAVPVTSNIISVSDLAPIIFDSKSALYEELSDDFTKEMDNLKHYLLEQIPARKFELEEIKKAKGKEAKALESAANLRQQEEELRIERERLQKEKDDAAAIELAKQVNQAELSFNQDMGLAEIRGEQTAAVKHSFVIEVKTKIGWQQIAALWLAECLKDCPIDRFEKKTLGSMKKDLETLAFNGGKRLDDSGHLIYMSDVKALTKRT